MRQKEVKSRWLKVGVCGLCPQWVQGKTSYAGSAAEFGDTFL